MNSGDAPAMTVQPDLLQTATPQATYPSGDLTAASYGLNRPLTASAVPWRPDLAHIAPPPLRFSSGDLTAFPTLPTSSIQRSILNKQVRSVSAVPTSRFPPVTKVAGKIINGAAMIQTTPDPNPAKVSSDCNSSSFPASFPPVTAARTSPREQPLTMLQSSSSPVADGNSNLAGVSKPFKDFFIADRVDRPTTQPPPSSLMVSGHLQASTIQPAVTSPLPATRVPAESNPTSYLSMGNTDNAHLVNFGSLTTSTTMAANRISLPTVHAAHLHQSPSTKPAIGTLPTDSSGHFSTAENKLTTFKGEPAVFFSDKQIVDMASPLCLTLIGKFSHGKPYIKDICKAIDSIGLRGGHTTRIIDRKHILVRFSDEEDF